jgi:hypothetical protein
MINTSEPKKRGRTKSIMKRVESEADRTGESSRELFKEYEILKESIESDNLSEFTSIIVKRVGMKYFLTQNDLDYELYKLCIKHKREKFIEFFETFEYDFNKNMLLIELYDLFMDRKSGKEPKGIFDAEDYENIITYENGKYLDTPLCLVEFYFLMLCEEFNLALLLLKQPYAKHLIEDINQMFIGDEKHLIQNILTNSEIAKSAIRFSLQRELDGVA